MQMHLHMYDNDLNEMDPDNWILAKKRKSHSDALSFRLNTNARKPECNKLFTLPSKLFLTSQHRLAIILNFQIFMLLE